MFYAMKFTATGWGTYTVRTVRKNPYKSLENARKAVIKSGTFGYVKKIGVLRPIWSNLLEA
jgi:hypothetical protein